MTCLSQRPGVNITPAIAPDGTIYSVTVAHNPFASRYAYIVAFNPDLSVKWRWQNTNTNSCSHNKDGSISCVSDHPSGFEWCVNAPGVDGNGTVFANSDADSTRNCSSPWQ